ncbi:MAG: hypothetical protein ACRC8A_18890 [Microcoleaceae cyanobacterium]
MSTISSASDSVLNPSRPSKIQIEIKNVVPTGTTQNTAAPLNVDSDGGD